MKKLFLTAVLIMSAFTFVSAQSVTPTPPVKKATQPTTVVQDDWKEVKMETLNIKVQAAIKAHLETCDVKSLLYSEPGKLTKVVLVKKSDKSEKIVIFDNEGKEVKKK